MRYIGTLLEAIYSHWPGSRVTWLTNPHYHAEQLCAVQSTSIFLLCARSHVGRL